MCCAWLAANTGHKKIAKKLRSGHHSTTLSGYIFASKAPIDNWKKKLLNSNVSPDVLTPHNMVNIGSLADEICWRVWGNLQISTGFTSCQGLGNVTAWHWHSSSWRQPNFVALNTGIGATYIQQGGHHVGHWPTFLVSVLFLILRPHRSTT